MNKKSILYIMITALCFGTMEAASKLGGTAFNSIQLVFLRFLIGGLILLPFAMKELKQKKYRLTRSDWGYLLLLGFICVCFSMAMLQIGVEKINANLASIIISMNPLFTMIFAHFIVHDRFTARKAVVLLVSFTGLLIIVDPGKMMQGNIAVDGLIITLLSAISFGLYTALGKLRLEKLGGMVQNSFSFLLGSFVLLIYMLAGGLPVIEGINLSSLPLLLYLGVVVTGLGYYAFLKAIAIAGPSNASIAFFIKPVIAPLVAFALLGEKITVNLMIGVVIILLGSMINMGGKKRREDERCR